MAVVTNIRDNYSEMTPSAKLMLFLGIGLILAIFIGGLYFIFRTEYTVLFSDLESRDASAIVKELDKNKVEYMLEDNGSRILVQDNEVYDTRLKVVNSVPMLSGGVGFEIFDKDDFGTTEFAQKINYQRALQGELARTIMALDEVKMARVHLVLPSSSIFKQKKTESSASVTLLLHYAKEITKEQVLGIQRLVASSAPNLKPQNVIVLDQKGVTLAANDSDEYNLALASKKLQKKQEIERYLAQKAQGVLDMALGYEKAFVTVDVSMDFNNTKKTREQVLPAENNISRKKETRLSDGKKQSSNKSRSSVEIDYELSKEVEQVVTTPGSVSRLSIAVIVSQQMSADEMEYIRSVVGNAVGYNPQRGDNIAVTTSMAAAIPVAAASTPAMLESPGAADTMSNQMQQMPAANTMANVDKKYQWMADLSGIISSALQQHPIRSFLTMAVIVSLFVLLLVYLLLFRARSAQSVKSANKTSVSADEREKLLSELKQWLAVEAR